MRINTTKKSTESGFLQRLLMVLAICMMAAGANAQISLPYTENFSGITANNLFPTVAGGSWARTGTTTLQPTYITNQGSYGRAGRGDTKFMSFRYGNSSPGNVYTVGPFTLSAGTTYQVSTWYVTDGLTGHGPLSLTYGTGTTLALQSNTIVSLPADLTNSTYQEVSGSFSPATTGSYYIGIKLISTGNPWYLTVDDFSVQELIGCTGAPAPGNTLANLTAACANTPVTLTLQNTPTTGGITYQWQTSSNGTVWTPVATGGTSSSYTVSQLVATYYRAVVTCVASAQSATSTPVQVTQNPSTSCYCIPVSTTPGYYINNFTTTGGILNITNNASGDATTSPGYSNFTTKIASGMPGAVISFAGSYGASSTNTFGTAIYVDWNHNGDFTDPGETVFNTPGYATSFSGSFTVPNAPVTGPTRMRVRTDYLNGTGPASCGSITYSEAEDYTFDLVPLPVCAGVPVAGNATGFSPVNVTGFTADVIANGVGAPTTSTTGDVDGVSHYFLDSTYQFTSTSAVPIYAFPANGVIRSQMTPGLTFKLQSAAANNSLRIATTNAPGILTLPAPIAASNVYLLATSGSGSAIVDVKLTFANATTQTVTGLAINDWYGGTPYAFSGMGRVDNANNQDGSATDPRLYQLSIPVDPANTSLLISSITVTRASGTGIVQVLGVSASTPTPIAGCVGNTSVITAANVPTASGISYQWQQSATSGGPYVNVTGGSGDTTLKYTTPVLSATTYYVLKVSCSFSSMSSLSTPVAIVVNPTPTVTINALPASSAICGTGSVALTASATGTGISYTWSPATALSSTTTAATVASPTSSTIYTVTATSAAGCSNTASKIVTVSQSTTITATATPKSVCVGSTVTLSAIDTNQGPSVMNGGYTAGSTTYPTSDEDFGNITFGSLNNTTTCGSLVGTIGTAVGVGGGYADFTGLATPNYIVGSSYSLSLSSITCGGNYGNSLAMYIDYNQNGAFTDPGEQVFLSPTTISGPHTETATVVIPATAATGVTRLRVIVNEGTISGPQMSPAWGEIEDYSIRLIKTPTILPGSYTWSPATGLSSTTGTPVTLTATAGTTTYNVSGTDNLGCPATGSVTLTINPIPTITVTPATAAICLADSTTLTASGASTYSWSPATGLSATTGASVKASPSVTTTYTITGTSAAGCVGTTTKTVTVNSLPTVTVTPATASAICVGSSLTLKASGASTYSWAPAGSLSAATGDSVSASPITTTTYVVTGTAANGCKNTASKVVTVNQLPTVTISPATAITICKGTSVSLIATGATSYSWAPAATLSAASGDTVTATPTANTTYIVTGTDGNGCTNTASKDVNVNALPVITVTPSTATGICNGSNVTLTASGANTYSWSPSASLSAATGASVIATPTATTTYIVSGTDSNGCIGTFNKLVTVNPKPTVTILPATSSIICNGNSVVLTAGGAASYSWSPATGLSATTGATVTAAPATTTTYTVTGIDVNGCINTATKTITVTQPTPLVITPTTPTIICRGASIALTASGAPSFVWSPAAGLSSTTGTTVLATPLGTTTYTATYTDANGCISTGTKLITVNQLPVITISPASTVAICPGGSATLTATGASSYSWTPTASLNITTGATVTATPAVTTGYTVTGTDANGCISTANKVVTVNSLPVIAILPASASTVCSGAGIALTATGGVNYTWSPAATLSASTGTTVTATPIVNTTYTVIGIDANGCSNTASKLVSVNARPVISISPASATGICVGETAALTASGGVSYSWSPASSLNSSTATTVIASPTTTTTYTVTGTGANGCTNTATKLVTVNPLPVLVVTPAGATTICIGSSVTLGVSGASNYSWSPAGSLNTSTGNSVIASPMATTTYTITGTNVNGCIASTTKTVTVIAAPSISVTPAVSTVCNGTSIVLTASGANTYNWSPSVSLNSATGTSVVATPGTTTTYTVTGTAANGCISTGTALVNVNQLPTVAIAPQGYNIACPGVPVTLTASGAISYVWSPSSDLSNSTGSVVSATNRTSSIFTVVGTDANGCSNITNVAVVRFGNPDATITPAGLVNLCIGDTASLKAVNATYPAYDWMLNGNMIPGAASSRFVPAFNGTYVVKVTDTNGCSAVTELPALVTFSAVPTPAIIANGTLLSTSDVYQTYQWYRNGQPIPGANNRFYTADRDGLYTVMVSNTAGSGCMGTSASYRITSLGLANASLKDAVKLYPNPATTMLHISSPVPVTVTVSGMDGRTILVKENAVDLDISKWANGVYNVMITDKQGALIRVEKVVKLNQ